MLKAKEIDSDEQSEKDVVVESSSDESEGKPEETYKDSALTKSYEETIEDLKRQIQLLSEDSNSKEKESSNKDEKVDSDSDKKTESVDDDGFKIPKYQSRKTALKKQAMADKTVLCELLSRVNPIDKTLKKIGITGDIEMHGLTETEWYVYLRHLVKESKSPETVLT